MLAPGKFGVTLALILTFSPGEKEKLPANFPKDGGQFSLPGPSPVLTGEGAEGG